MSRGGPYSQSQVQRVYANRICTSLPSSLRIAWKGVLKPRHFLGVRLAVMTMSWISSSDTCLVAKGRGRKRQRSITPLVASTDVNPPNGNDRGPLSFSRVSAEGQENKEIERRSELTIPTSDSVYRSVFGVRGKAARCHPFGSRLDLRGVM